MTKEQTKDFFFRATPAIVWALVGLLWTMESTKRDEYRRLEELRASAEDSRNLETHNKIAAKLDAISTRVDANTIQIAIIEDRENRRKSGL